MVKTDYHIDFIAAENSGIPDFGANLDPFLRDLQQSVLSERCCVHPKPLSVKSCIINSIYISKKYFIRKQ